MRKVLGLGLSAAAVIATGLIPTAAGAAVTGTSAHTSTLAGPGGDPDTTVTFAVTSGDLTLTAPGSANLGTGLPGSTIGGRLGQMKVTDNRAALVATWTVTASLTDFITGAGPTRSTIPATAADYDPGQVTATGAITVVESRTGLSGTPATVVECTAGTGNNTATWNPLIGVDVPPAAVGGGYSGTLTQSVA